MVTETGVIFTFYAVNRGLLPETVCRFHMGNREGGDRRFDPLKGKN